MPDAELTPVDRPLMRSDLNDIRLIVQGISERQLAFQAAVHRRLWLPTLLAWVAVAFSVLVRLVP
jgi:hypothetical protein